jgi:DNA-binding NarL/FixJ family response regulator/HPt (histidine-containing phosphotransfer) domain-containing protein
MTELLHSSPKLLLVDDDRVITEMLTWTLEDSLAGEVAVQSTSDPATALRQLEQATVDILVTDLEMPGINGLQLLRSAKEWNPCVQVLFVTGNSTLDALTDALEHGASDYLLKPVNREIFLKVVREALTRCRRWREALAGTLAARRRRRAMFGQAAASKRPPETPPSRPLPMVYSSLGGDPELGGLVDLFVGELPGRVASMQTAADGRDWEQVTVIAHQLKGAAGSYGFDALTPYARDLEYAARDSGQAETILRALGELSDICRRVRAGVGDTEHVGSQ